MPTYAPPRRRLAPTLGDPDISDVDLMTPMGLPGAVGGVMAKVARALTDPKAIEMLDELLGQTLLMGNKVNRLSSFNPARGIARLIDTESGERLAVQVRELAERLQRGQVLPGVYEPLQEGTERASVSSGERFLRYPQAAPTQAGTRIPRVNPIGPRGGTTTGTPRRRRIPGKATR